MKTHATLKLALITVFSWFILQSTLAYGAFGLPTAFTTGSDTNPSLPTDNNTPDTLTNTPIGLALEDIAEQDQAGTATKKLSNNLYKTLKVYLGKINSQFDKTFVAKFDNDGNVKELSSLMNTVQYYMYHFYSTFITRPFSTIDFTFKYDNVDKGLKTLLSKDFLYNTQTGLDQKLKNTQKLLIASNPGKASESDVTNDEGVDWLKDATDLGSLDTTFPQEDIASAPTAWDLLGPKAYDTSEGKEEDKKAKRFINMILQASPPPKTFIFPPKPGENSSVSLSGGFAAAIDALTGDSSENKGPQVKFYLPYSNDPNKTYTEKSLGYKDYAAMLSKLYGNKKFFQKYQMKTQAANAIRTLYLETIFSIYQARLKTDDKKTVETQKKADALGPTTPFLTPIAGSSTSNYSNTQSSLAEREHEIAVAALDSKYYKDLKSSTVADINLETLYAINKLVYGIHEVNKKLERLSLLIAVSGLGMNGPDIQDEMNYIKPVAALIENECWKDYSDPADEAKKSICDNPLLASTPSTTPKQ